MDRRSFLRRLAFIPAALIGAKLVEKLPEKTMPVVTVPQPLPNYLPYVQPSGPIWISPGTWGGWCPACVYPTITSALHTHNNGMYIYGNTSTAGTNSINGITFNVS